MLRSGSAWGLSCAGIVLGAALAFPARAQNTPVPAPAAAPAATQPAGQPPASQPAGKPKLRIDQPTFEFPEVWSGDKVDHTFILANDGDVDLHVLSVQPSCGCTVAGQFDKVIAPGKTGKVPLSLSTLRYHGQITKTIQVQTDDPTTPRTQLILKGNVKQRVSIEPMAGANWAELTPSSPEEIKVTLTNNTDKPFKIEYVPDTQPALAGRLSVFEPAVSEKVPGKVAEVNVKLKKPVSEGWHGGQLKFKTGIEAEPEVFIPCNVTVVPPIQVMPAAIAATLQAGQEYKQTVTIRYTRGESVKIMDIKTSDPKISTQLVESQPGKLFLLTVILPAGFDGAGQVEVATDLKENPKITIPIRARQLVAATQPSFDAFLGKPAQPVSLKTPDGGEIKFGGPSDQITVVDFFATWCPHCRKQLPLLQKVHDKFKDKVRFVIVSTDGQRKLPKNATPQEIAEFAKNSNLTMPLALDPDGQAAPKYNATGLPTMVVIGKTGQIEAFHRGEELDPETKVSTVDSRLEVELNLLLAGKTRADFPPRPVRKLATQPATVAITGPSLKLDSNRVDTGLHKPGDTVRAYISYRNQGNQPLNVTIKPAAGLTIDSEYAKQLAAGAAGLVRCEYVVPKNPGAYSFDISFESNDPAHAAAKVALVGVTQGYVEFTPPSGITFARTPRARSIPMVVTLTYNGDGKVEYSTPEVSSDKFTAVIEPLANSRYSKLTVTAKGPFVSGENDATIRVKTSCKEQPLVEIPVRLFNPPRIEITPPEAKVQGPPPVQRALVTIQNNGDKPFAILGVKPSNEAIRYQFFPEPDGLSYRVMVSVQLPGNGGTLQDPKVTITTDDKEYGELVIPIKMEPAPAPNAARQGGMLQTILPAAPPK